ncbi:MAG TPA: transglutaminase domain-containing protein [Thermoanaerobaculia bacterium]|nr:transglutaminase domain-containing protein [Thermoanaerobaculia bacterium]
MFDLVKPPTAADLYVTEDAPRTAEIVELVNRLGGDPVRIFNEVSTSILFEPYYGSRKGAHLTLLQRSGSAIDIANLLAALLRASGHPVRYMTGRVTGSAEEMEDWLGAASADAAVAILNSGGIAAKKLPLGGIEFEHAWVAVHANGRWTELDATFKKLVRYRPTIDAEEKTPLPQFLSRVVATGALDVANKRVLLAPRVRSPERPDDFDYDIDLVQERVAESIAASAELINDATDLRDVFGYSEVFAPKIASLADVRPFRNASLISARTTSLLPAAIRSYLTIEVDPIVVGMPQKLTYRASLPALAGKSITLVPVAATDAEQALIDSRGGTLLRVPWSTRVRTVLSIDGVEVARGPDVEMRTACDRVLKIEQPSLAAVTVENRMNAADTLGVTIDYGRTSVAEMEAAHRRLDDVRESLPVGSDGVPLLTAPEHLREPFSGAALYAAAQGYHAQNAAFQDVFSHRLGVRWVRHAAVGWVLQPVGFDLTAPLNDPVHSVGLGFDLPVGQTYAWSSDGDAKAVRAFQGARSAVSSALEHYVWEALGLRAVSAVRVMHLSTQRGVPVRSGITKANWSQISSGFHVNTGVLIAVTDAVNKGYTVTLPERNITVGDWTGTGFVVTDPATGAAGYIISGGLGSGGDDTTFGGLTSDKMIGGLGYGLALANLGLAGRDLAAGVALMFGGGPAGFFLGGALAAAAIASMAETFEDINRYNDGETSAEEFFNEQFKDLALDLWYQHTLGDMFRNIVNAKSGGELDAMSKIWEHGLSGFTEILAGTKDLLVAGTLIEPLTKKEVILLALHCSIPRMWKDLYTLQQKRGSVPVWNVIRNQFYIYDRAIVPVVRALAHAPDASGVDALIVRASEGPSYSAAYALNFAVWAGDATRYGREYAVTFTPVTGFAADGNPIFGPPSATTLFMPVEVLLGQWFFTQHAPIGRSDLRAWNAVMKLKAAVDAGLRGGVTVWTPGGVESGLRVWTQTNAPKVRINVFQNDSLR